jgi:hypothetical protein
MPNEGTVCTMQRQRNGGVTMYMIIWWITEDYMTCVHNSNGSIHLFETLKEADDYANFHECDDDMRVISTQGVEV